MAEPGKHRQHRHRLERPRPRLLRLPRRRPLVLAPLAVAATAGAVAVGMAVAEPSGPDLTQAVDAAAPAAAVPTALDSADVARLLVQRLSLDRGTSRTAQDSTNAADRVTSRASVEAAIEQSHIKRWTTTALNLWREPGQDSRQDGELAAGKRVLLTGRTKSGRLEIVTGEHQTRWVTKGYVTDTKPAGPNAPLSTAPCPDSSVESGLSSSAIAVYRAVCHAYPQITTYGGYSPRGEHASGNAIDIMTTDPALLVSIADFLQAHATELNLYDIIRLQHIWTPVRAAEGWRLMPDRGSPTANHMDHVHVSTN